MPDRESHADPDICARITTRSTRIALGNNPRQTRQLLRHPRSDQKGDLDITPWLAWFPNCLDRAFNGTERILASVFREASFWEAHAATAMNGRQRAMVNRLLTGFEGKLTTSKWAKIAKCSQDTALRDIEELVRSGVLAKGEGGGRSTNYVLVGNPAG